MSKTLSQVNNEIAKVLSEYKEDKVVYLYKKYGEYQFTLHDSMKQVIEKIENHTELGEWIAEPISVFDCHTNTLYTKEDIREGLI